MTEKYLTPIQAIKQKCKVWCCVGDTKSWKYCTITNCPLYPYRLGKRPKKIQDSPIDSSKNEVIDSHV